MPGSPPASSPPGSQRATPAAAPAPAAPAAPANAGPAPPLQVPAAVQHPNPLPFTRCTKQGCRQTRLAPDCGSRMCRKHCMDAGGCQLKAHTTPPVNPPAQPPPSPQAGEPAPAPSRTPPPHANAAAAAGSSTGAIDPRPDPRYISQMPAIFTEQFRREQELAEQKRSDDERRLAAQKKAKQTVTLYAWPRQGSAPQVFEFQTGFMWPWFPISRSILDAVGFASNNASVQLYREGSGTWVGIAEGHVVELREGDCIFLKASTNDSPVDFDQHLSARSKRMESHLRHNLRGEREYVREKLKRKGSASASPRVSPPPSPPPPSSRQHHGPRSQQPLVPAPSPKSPRPQSSRKTVKRPRIVRRSPSPEVIIISSDTEPDVVVKSEPIGDRPVKEEERNEEDSDSYPDEGGSVSSDPLSPGSSPSQTRSSSSGPSWPQDYPVNDIIAFFNEVKDNQRKRKIREIFSIHFPDQEYHKSTHHDNQTKWRKAPQSIRNKSCGCKWLYFLQIRNLNS